MLFLLLIASSIQGQSIAKYVFDISTKEAIQDVHIIVTNSSISSVSEANGAYYLNEKDILGQDVIFSHINYDLTTISVSLDQNLPDTVFLKAASQEIEEVVVSSKRSNLKTKRLKKFKYDLFMSDNLKINKYFKKCEIKNEEVLFFEERDKTLIASSKNLIELHNAYLGYDLYFLLENYTKKNVNVRLAGKAVFQEIKSNSISTEKYLKRREAVYELSLPKFLGHLLSGSIHQSNFRCYIQDPVKPDEGYYELQGPETYEQFVLSTDIDDVYAFSCPSKIEIVNDISVSSIFSESGLILFNSKGVILNKEELKMEGYWARLSLAEQLPNDYKSFDYEKYPTLPFTRKYSIGELKSLAYKLKYTDSASPAYRDLILETDRVLYNSGESIFIRGKYLDHSNNELWQEEELVYLELIDPNKKVIARKTKLIQNGVFETGFYFDFIYPNGQYVVRAYTDYLKNFPPRHYPYKVVGLNALWNERQARVGQKDSLFVNFHAEGGHLVQEQENIVVFTVKDKYGNPIPFQGAISEAESKMVIPLRTIDDGFGTFTLLPKTGSKYKLESSLNMIHDLDQLKAQNVPAINVFARDSAFFNVKIISNILLPNYTLNIWFKNNIVYSINNLDVNKVYKLSKSFLPKDILMVRLVSNEGKNVSERLIDNSEEVNLNIKTTQNYAFYFPSQNGELQIELDEASLEQTKNLKWDLKIVHQEYDPHVDLNIGVLEENETMIDNIRNTLTPINYNHIRNLELVANKPSQKILDTYQLKKDDLKIKGSKMQTVSGRIVNRFDNEAVKSRISISRLSEVFYYDEIDSDENGKFMFSSVPYFENASFLLQARMDIAKKDDFSKGNRNVIIELDSTAAKDDVSDIKFEYLEELKPTNFVSDPFEEQELAFNLNQLIEEVTVEGRRIKTHNLGSGFNLNDEEWLADETSGLELIARLYPSKRIRYNPDEPFTLQVYVRKGINQARFINLAIVINGQLQQSPGFFLSMIADDIAYINLNGSVLIVATNPGFNSRSELEEEKYGILQYALKENLEDIKFEDIDNLNGQIPELSDNRKTLLWLNDIVLSSSTPLLIPFKTSNITGNYKITLSTLHPKYGYISYDWDIEVREPSE